MSKVKIGCRNFQYAVVKDGLCTTAPKSLPGLTAAKLDIKNDMKNVAADDKPYASISGGISETTLDVKLLDLKSEARQDFFGLKVVKGIEQYNKDLTPNDIACCFEVHTEDGRAVYVGLLSGKFSIPGMDTKTIDGTPDPLEDETTGTFVSREGDVADNILVIGREDNTGFDKDTFMKYVFAQTAADVQQLSATINNGNAA